MNRGRLATLAAAVAASLGLATAVQAVPLDPSFDGDGFVLTDLGSGSEVGRAVARQPDGKLVVGGSVHVGDWAMGFARYNADGSLDPSFGTGGTVVTNFGGGQDLINDLVLQPDGKIVGVGDSSTDSNNFAFVRYTADGQLDTSFDGDGISRVNFTTPTGASGEFPHAVARQPDGKLVAAGGHNHGGQGGGNNFAVARVNGDGSLDPAFDGDGRVLTDMTGDTDWAHDVAVVDGKILVAGFGGASAAESVALARYNEDGSLDASFGEAGKVLTHVTGRDYGFALGVQPDGRILVAGTTAPAGTGGGFNAFVQRYLPDGTLDSSFAGDGSVVVDFGSTSESFDWVGVDAAGNVLAAGSSFQNGFDMALARLTPDGALDSSFDGDGKQLVNFGIGRHDQALDALIQPNGAIVLAGTSNLSGNSDFALARLHVPVGQPPSITAPPDVDVGNAPGLCSAAPSLGEPTGSDAEGPFTIATSGVPADGIFPVGDTTVTYTALDTDGNQASDTQRVRVRDVEPPTISTPDDVTVATDPGSALATVQITPPTASDNCPITVTGTRSDFQMLSAQFRMGRTTITWRADDAGGHIATVMQQITVLDLEPPTLLLPQTIAVDATAPTGANVSYTASVADNAPGSSVACSPASGAVFPAGDTVVECIASDTSGNSTTGMFVVHVRGAAEQAENLQALVSAMNLQQGIENSLDAKLANVRAALDAARAGDPHRACNVLGAFITEVEAQERRLTAEQVARLTADAARIRSVLAC